MIQKDILDRFVVLEGIDGAGTTTQVKLLETRLRGKGISHWATCEPTTGKIGRLIREILSGRTPAEPKTVAMLFAADRHQHLYQPEAGILAHVGRGEIVVTDRYLFSSLAYQSVDCGFEYVSSLNADFPLPSLLIYLDVSAEEGNRRSESRSSREIYEHTAFQTKVIERYERAFDGLAEVPGTRFLKIDGSQDPGLIHEKIWSAVSAIPI